MSGSSVITWRQAAEKLAAARRIAVFTHENPDGDAIGSSTGLVRYLLNAGKDAELFLAADAPKIYQDFVCVNYRTELTPKELHAFDLVVQLDTATSKRQAVPAGVAVNSDLPLLVIDHHVDNQLYGRWNLVQKTSATAEMIWNLINEAVLYRAENVDAAVATSLLLGVITDTGAFRFDNTTPEALAAAGKLLALNGNYRKIINDIFFTKSLNRQQFEAELLNNHLQLYANGKLALVQIPDAVIKKYNIVMADTEGLIDAFRCLAGVETAVTMYMRGNNQLKISGRAKNPAHPIGPVMRKLGGGGHEMAAGCLIPDGDMAETAKKIISLIEDDFR